MVVREEIAGGAGGAGGVGVVGGVGGQTGADERSIAGQSYRLRIERGAGGRGCAVSIVAGSRSGLRYAWATLGQLRRLFPDALPCGEIEDGPAFAVRGAMLDVSRDRVPTMRELLGVVDQLAELKYNHLQLYTEHTFAYAGHESAWQGCGAMTAEEYRRLDAHCAARGIELAANQNCFGHLARWLRLPAYRHLAETHGDWMFDVWPRSGPFSLCPVHAGSIELVRDWLRQITACVGSGLINIGCDETYDVGFGASKAEAARRGGGARGRVSLYVEFVNRIAEEARKLGRRPMFWADIALSRPESMAELDPALIALVWGYEGDAPFARGCVQAAEAPAGAGRREVWVCPGTSSWRSITGRSRERRANLEAAAVQGLANGASGFLACDWGDVGHRQVWPVSLHGLAHAAHAAWAGSAESGFSPEAVGVQMLGDASGRAGVWLEELGDSDVEARDVAMPLSRPGVSGALRNATALFADLHTAMGDGLVVPAEPFARAWERLRGLRKALPTGLGPLVHDELEHAVMVAELAAERAVLRRATGGIRADDRGRLADQLAEIERAHRRLWLIRSRAGGLEESAAHYARVRAGLVDA